MMKVRLIKGVVCLLTVIVLCSACGDQDSSDEKEDDKKQATAIEIETNKEEQEAEEEQKETEEEEESEPEEVKIRVYFSNDDATAFASEEVEIPSLSPEAVLEALISKEALPEDVQVNSYAISETDGKKCMDLDLNDAFASYLSRMGSTGEYYVMGAVCNTFLDAYECDRIKITVDGGVLATGHTDYPGYQGRFE